MSQVHLCFPDDDAKLPDLYSTCKKNGRKCFLGNKKVPFLSVGVQFARNNEQKGYKNNGKHSRRNFAYKYPLLFPTSGQIRPSEESIAGISSMSVSWGRGFLSLCLAPSFINLPQVVRML